MNGVSGWQPPALGQERLELAVVLGSKSLEERGCALTVGLLPQADWIRFGFLALARDLYAVDPCTIEAENLGLKLRGALRIAMCRDELGRDLKGAKGLDLVLRRAVPD